MTESDQLIQQKLETFGEYTDPDGRTLRYLETIQEYYGRAYPEKQKPREKYNSVFSMINRMWQISGKSIPEVLEVWRDFEPILQNLETKESYRDHFIHSSNVFLLGYYIINELRRTCDLKGTDLGINDIELAWMMASTFHDVAYPIQEMESWLNNLFLKMLGIDPRFDYNITQIVPMAYNEFMKMIADYHSHRENNLVSGRVSYLSMDWSIYDKLNSELIRKDHGVLSALMLAHVLAIRKGFATKNDGRYWNFTNIHMPAIHAISLHTLKSVNVEFSKHPIAFLLVLCDELQDWGRPEKRPRNGIIDLLGLSVVKDSVPCIRIQIKASQKSSSNLAKSLSRLCAKERIKVSISDKDGNAIVEIL